MLSLNKVAIRQKILDLRETLDTAELEKKSSQIFNRLIGLKGIKGAKKILSYVSFKSEVKTKDLIDWLARRGVTVYLPAFDEQNQKYVIRRFGGWDKLKPGPCQILQPTSVNMIADVDVAIVPGVAFSKSGARLGYGKGVYDRLLLGSKAFKIGIAYDFQIVDSLPQEERDVVMDLVISEKNIYGGR